MATKGPSYTAQEVYRLNKPTDFDSRVQCEALVKLRKELFRHCYRVPVYKRAGHQVCYVHARAWDIVLPHGLKVSNGDAPVGGIEQYQAEDR